MARSKPRRAAKEKAVKERRDHLARSAEYKRLWDLAHVISGDNPPGIEASDRSAEEIESWFDSDPSAPLVLFRYPLVAGDGHLSTHQVMISVNAHGIERELRAHGLDETHPSWDEACFLTQKTVLEVSKRVAVGVYQATD